MRTEDDQWGITESVGVTALGVASGRAMETHRPDGLVHDPYAEAFVDAAAGEIRLPKGPEDARAMAAENGAAQDDGATEADWQEQSAYIGVRSRFFDDALTAATADGVRQVVLLAAGLDTRAQRLDWPADTVVYEVDQHGVLDFKDDVLAEQRATTAGGGARRVVVRVDLRHDWSAALREAGFDPGAPTAWLAEGLLPYLPAQAEIDLFDRIGELSAPGSHLAVEHFGDIVHHFGREDSRLASLSRRFGVDIRELFFADDRPDAAERLGELGWTVTGRSASELAESYGRPLDPELADVHGAAKLLDARR
ncbi:putative S-adenosyl-L-methionine-dependent methyltransferase [Actinomycetospora sp. NBRC 106375]|uniref:SAM-dependent methyltransferase n=1 Tax=Actinomycetospora sp. NBRC 106375 TaxID=3032207 RepID=UPI0024A2B3D7|nr:SAM-dependent methyltransferase [Actinomycetospora sp. NBRC 106375]GLZ46854.1 putative S-adenosyl-L-methionine-dependent methyltransferase [Actinomycetospora sp. NBRC 106375]